MPWAKHLKKVFYVELLLNLLSAIQIFFAGDSFVAGFGATPNPILNLSFTWFACLILVITYIIGRALFSNNETALRYALEGYIIGDIVFIIVLIAFINAIGSGWTTMAFFSVASTSVLTIIRILYLWGTRKPATIQ